MSASSKKKLRHAEDAKKMTEKQLNERKEAKKLQLYTIAVVTVVILMVIAAVWIAVSKSISNSGINQRKTVAATVGEHQISSAELSYFYLDTINKFANQYGSYVSIFGLDVTTPLNEQYYDEENGQTWADYFISSAVESARATYALSDDAAAAGYTLSDSEKSSIESDISTLGAYATIGGYTSLEQYLKAIYGAGATEEGYRSYREISALAQSYSSNYASSLTYTDEQLREAEKDNYNQYSVFTYNTYFVSATKFLQGGTADEDGNTTYSDEEIAASVKAAEEAAKALTEMDIADVDAFNAAIAAMDINKESTSASCTSYTDTSYSNVVSTVRDWVTDSSRQPGDMTYIENINTSTDADGNEVSKVSGYYVVLFGGSNDNNYPLANIRHILVSFQGGTTDSNGNTTYSDEEKAAAKNTAEELLATWMSGEATEESFGALAIEKSDDEGSAANAGLYEDVYPGQMVEAFNDWCFAENRKPGDTGIVETEYGYHVMYYSGDSDTTYRDYLIENDLATTDYTQWRTDLIEAVPAALQNPKYLRTDLVLSNG